jgi:4-amino-4-deoxy-L-arabinose transferase-like glycosyltransferase
LLSLNAVRLKVWPLALFVLAALLRFSYLSEIEHNVDQAYPIWQALNTLERGQWPLVGQGTSVLFANPTLTGYLYLPFVAFTRSPLGAYLLVIALNSLAVPLAYKAVRGLLGHRPGLIAAVLMVVNPWVIEYSRSTWVQSLLPFFTCALAWLLWPVLTGQTRKPGRRLLLALIVLTLMTQTYLLAYLMIAPVGLLLLIFRRRIRRLALLTGGTVFIAALLLYGAGLLAQISRVQQDVSEFASAPAQLSMEAWNHALRLISGADYPLARGQNAPIHDWELRQNVTQIAHYMLLTLLLAGLALALHALLQPSPPRLFSFTPKGGFARAKGRKTALKTPLHEGREGDRQGRLKAVLARGQLRCLQLNQRFDPLSQPPRGFGVRAFSTPSHQRDTAIILLIWFGLPVLLMSYVGQRVHPFYLLLTLPAGYALVGWACAGILHSVRTQRLCPSGYAASAYGERSSLRPYSLVMIVLGIPFAALMIVNSQRFAQETAATPGAHDLGALPLDYGIQLAHTVTAHLPPDGIVYAEVDEWTLNSLAGTTFPLHRDTRAPQFSIIPRGGGVYVFPFASLPTEWQGPAYTTMHKQIQLPDGVVLTVDAYPADAAQQVTPHKVLNIASEEGLKLIGYDLSENPAQRAAPLQGEGEKDGTSVPSETPLPQGEGLGVRATALSTYWRVESPAPADWRFTPFAQVYDSSGQRIAVVEGAMVTGDEWRVGDVHVHRMTLPPGTASIKLGQFDGPRQRNIIFLPEFTPLIDIVLEN